MSLPSEAMIQASRKQSGKRKAALAAVIVLATAPVALFSQTQRPGTNPKAAEVKATEVKFVAGGRIKPHPLDRNRSAPPPLSVEQKRNILLGLVAGFRLDSKNASAKGLALLPMNWTNSTIMSFSPPRILSVKTPSVDGLGSLLFNHAQIVDSIDLYAGWDSGFNDTYLGTMLQTSAHTTYVLDYTVAAFGKSQIYVDMSGASSQIACEVGATQGHILIPFVSGSGGPFAVVLSNPDGWLFYSLQIEIAS